MIVYIAVHVHQHIKHLHEYKAFARAVIVIGADLFYLRAVAVDAHERKHVLRRLVELQRRVHLRRAFHLLRPPLA